MLFCMLVRCQNKLCLVQGSLFFTRSTLSRIHTPTTQHTHGSTQRCDSLFDLCVPSMRISLGEAHIDVQSAEEDAAIYVLPSSSIPFASLLSARAVSLPSSIVHAKFQHSTGPHHHRLVLFINVNYSLRTSLKQ